MPWASQNNLGFLFKLREPYLILYCNSVVRFCTDSLRFLSEERLKKRLVEVCVNRLSVQYKLQIIFFLTPRTCVFALHWALTLAIQNIMKQRIKQEPEE